MSDDVKKSTPFQGKELNLSSSISREITHALVLTWLDGKSNCDPPAVERHYFYGDEFGPLFDVLGAPEGVYITVEIKWDDKAVA